RGLIAQEEQSSIALERIAARRLPGWQRSAKGDTAAENPPPQHVRAVALLGRDVSRVHLADVGDLRTGHAQFIAGRSIDGVAGLTRAGYQVQGRHRAIEGEVIVQERIAAEGGVFVSVRS